MSPSLISAVVGLALMVMTLSAVSPSILVAIQAKNIEISIAREESIAQQIIRYRTVSGKYPVDMAELISSGYWRSTDNDNAFGGTYSIATDSVKGIVSISTSIADAKLRALYLSSSKHIYKPRDVGSGTVTKSYIIPGSGTLSSFAHPTSGTVVASVAPSAATNTYWYDTSGVEAKLMVSDGSAWKSVSTGGGSTSTSPAQPTKYYGSRLSLPSTGQNGDIQYAAGGYYDGYPKLLQYIRFNDAWYVISNSPQ